jgi:hypothetical protein
VGKYGKARRDASVKQHYFPRPPLVL